MQCETLLRLSIEEVNFRSVRKTNTALSVLKAKQLQWTTTVCNTRLTHTRLTALYPGQPGWAGTRKVKTIWILLKQDTVSGSGISWAICKSAPRSRQITTPQITTQFFTGRMPFLPPNQQRQSTEGTVCKNYRKGETLAHYFIRSETGGLWLTPPAEWEKY